MSTKSEYKTVDISNILNYAENPRHDVGTNEIDTIKKLINKVGSQYMYNLAKDIYENGLMGSNLPTLVFNTEKRKYVVYEGNRRVACLKFLNNPEILNTIDRSLKQRVENLIKKETEVYSTKIFCYVTNEEEALLIMERTHSGEDKGRGLKAWTPREQGVFQKRLKQKNSIALIIAELTEKFLNEDITQKISYTTIQRFFNNREVKKALQLDGEDSSKISKEKIEFINYLIDKSIEESNQREVALTRLFNKAREIEDFFIPLIEEYQSKVGSAKTEENTDNTDTNDDSKEEDSKEDNPTNTEDQNTEGKKDDSKEGTEESDERTDKSLKISLKKEDSKQTYFTTQTIDLMEKLELINDEKFDPELLVIDCPNLTMANKIVQPNNLPGEYYVTYKYYMEHSRELIYWQDSLKIAIKPTKTSPTVLQPQTVLSKTFFDKYYGQLTFDHSEKIKSLMYFLATENKNGKYSFFINIVTRMFLEYSFRMFASKVLKDDNQTIDEKSKSLQGFIDYCCNKIEQSDPRIFVKHIQRGRKEATSKVDILQKSIHYFDVTMSNDDIQVMFTNLTLYLEYVYEEILKEQFEHA
ncbi:hypothetical protein HFN20_03690 [Paenibacillus dendritiformis]|uniref:hypothetical protein n=1 Tax=Paenibacillus dendritiformis TaxID=130049 RepID=UPI00143D3CE4|nr:hypothetical protein [Paenibacillus dendritiformis]NKI20345.1 hypothetical protein [Paenibacillus dendritiformis]